MSKEIDAMILLEWLNDQLARTGGYVGDLFKDLRDGRNLILLLETLSGQQICREKGRLRVQMLKNANTVLDFLEEKGNDVSGIRAEDIVDGRRNQTVILVSMIMQQFQHSSSNRFDEGSVCGKIVIKNLAETDTQMAVRVGRNDLAEIIPEKSIWHHRMQSLVPLKLPYEITDDDVVDPKWELTAWSEPLVNSGIRDAKRVLLDAFVIYLARVTGEDTLHIGWQTGGRPSTQVGAKMSEFVVPMMVTIPLDVPWGSVSDAVDNELVFLSQNFGLPCKRPSSSASGEGDVPAKPLRPWRIVVYSILTRDNETEDPTPSGTLLTLQVRENGGFRWLYDATHLDSDVVERMSAHLRELVTDSLATSSIGTSVGKLNVLPREERTALLTKWNSAKKHSPSDDCLHHLLERRLAKAPTATALIYEDENITYAELNARANSLAHKLIDLGVVPDCLVGICVSVSPAILVGVIAILKAGGAYVPLDPSYPRQRLIDIIADASLNIIVADAIGSEKLGPATLATKNVIDPNAPLPKVDKNPVVRDLISRNLAYVIYTSGSTGRPKGVMVEHTSIVTLLDTMESRFDLSQSDVWCLFNSVAFDVSVWEIWGALKYGGQLVLMSRDDVRSPDATHHLLHESRVTVLNLTPSAFKVLVNRFIDRWIPRGLRYVIFSGELLDARVLQPLYDAYEKVLPRFVNMYGATETPIYVTHRALNQQDALRTSSIIGRCVPDTRIYLLDAYGRLVPLGAVGELCVGGPRIARGYLNRPNLTSERFLADPFDDSADARMYRTGDLARYLADGNLIFVGRNDDQIKLRGFRIEPGEIEYHLKCHWAVKDAFVSAVGVEPDKILVAHVIAEPTTDLVETLHRHLKLRLPAHMVPVAFVRLEQFPLAPNGKLDIKALPSVDETSLVRKSYEAPKTHFEHLLAGIWEERLGFKQVGRYDSFFALGGHSLTAFYVIEDMRKLGLTVTMSDLFQHPVLSDLALTVKDYEPLIVQPNLLTPVCIQLTPEMLPLIDLTQSDIDNIISRVPRGLADIQDIYDLSALQSGMLFHHLLSPTTTTTDPYLTMRILAFPNREGLDGYVEAFQKVVDRHDIMRTSFFWEGLSKPAQVVFRRARLSITELMLESLEEPVPDQLYNLYSSHYFDIDLTKPPLVRLVIARESEGRWSLLSIIHHLILDEETSAIMDAEVLAYIGGHEISARLPTPFRNHIAQFRRGVNEERHKQFFSTMLTDIDEPTLSFALENSSIDTRIVSHEASLEKEFSDQWRFCAKAFNVSMATLCHLAWALVVSRTSGNKRVVFGTVLFSRMNSSYCSGIGLGMFLNTLPVRIDVDETPACASLQRTKEILSRLLEHQHASLAIAQRCTRTAVDVLFNSIFNFRHRTPTKVLEMNHAPYVVLRSESRTNYPLVLSVDDDDIQMAVEVQVFESVNPARVCAYMREGLINLKEALDGALQQPLYSIEVIPKPERELLIDKWNRTSKSKPDLACLHHRFERQVLRNPGSTALIFEGETVTYTELNAQANRLAHRLIELGVVPETLVGICASIAPAMLVGLLAILKAGAAYVPLDPIHPTHRLRDIMNDASLCVIVADGVGIDKLGSENLSTRTVVNPNDRVARSEDNPVVDGLCDESLAYVIYTSGSTGQPKGVMVEHRNISSLFDATKSLFDFQQSDVWCLLHSIAFDYSAWEIWSAFSNGGQLVLGSLDVIRSPEATYRLICENYVTVLNETPNAFKVRMDRFLAKPVMDKLLYIIFGGESFDPRMLQPLHSARQKALPRFFNMYGPTETTVLVTVKELDEEDISGSTSLIGKPLSNTRTYLLDDYGRPVPIGAVGELYIVGPGVARGYLNRADLTSKSFLEDKFGDTFGAHMYKTGDLARYSPDGDIVFLGRRDQQVKLRGYRIETEEVAACLRKHSMVHDAVVVACGDHLDKQLVAYVVAEHEDVSILQSHAVMKLPAYMVPSIFVRVDAIPLTPNGKVDRAALPVTLKNSPARQNYEAPQGDIEITLAEIWAELLDLEVVSRQDSFFALGGHSLLAVQVIERMRCHGHHLDIENVFAHPILSELASTAKNHLPVIVPANSIARGITMLTPNMLPLIELDQTDIDVIVSKVPGGLSNVQDIYALSPLQDGIMFHHLMDPKVDPYLLIFHMRFANNRIIESFISAVQSVIDRHDTLRTAFFWKGLSTPAQVVLREATIHVTQMTLDPIMGTTSNQLNRLQNSNENRMDLQQAPLLRFIIARDNDGSWIVVQLMHHIIADHATLDILFAEIDFFMNDRQETLNNPVPYRNHLASLRSGVSREKHERFFTDLLADVNEPTLAFSLSKVHNNGTGIMQSQRIVDCKINSRLRIQAKTLNVSLATLCHLAWGLVVARTSERSCVVFGTVLYGRASSAQGSDSAMGLYINTLPMKLDLDNRPVHICARETHARLGELLEHESASLALVQRCSGIPGESPLFNSLLNYRHNRTQVGVHGIATNIEFISTQERSNYPLALSVDDDTAFLRISCQTDPSIDPERVCGYMQRVLQYLSSCLSSKREVSIDSIEVLPESERQILLQTFNHVEASHPDFALLHNQFQGHATLTPSAIALRYENEMITYTDLNSKANGLASQLIGAGVIRERLVGICVSDSPALLIGILAILKAGGAYVPLDPAYPRQRLIEVIMDASLSIIIADEIGFEKLEASTFDTRVRIDPNALESHLETNPVVNDLRPENLMAVLYTSGSTGRPKGVMIEHRNVVRLFDNSDPRFRFNHADVWCMLHSFAFDFSIWEMWGALHSGGQIVLMPRAVVRSMDATYGIICKYRVSVLNQTPSEFKVMADRLLVTPVRDHLRCIIIAAEALDARILRPVHDARRHTSIEFYNHYGPTETTMYVTAKNLNEQDMLQSISPIGTHIRDTRLYLLDVNRRPVPYGISGEIYISGPGVTRGYLNRPDLTGERFVADPFSDAVDARMYKTGDLARYMLDGNLEFIGRNDQQVKLRGYRIELGDVEACFRLHEAVNDVCVVVLGKELNKRLVAYVVTREPNDVTETLREYAITKLPKFMVPTLIIPIDGISLTHSGKIDLQALPQPDNEAFYQDAYEAPQGHVEITIASIWKELLNLEKISRHDSFFALGGHSLLAVLMIERIRRSGHQLTIQNLYSHPILYELAMTLTDNTSIVVPANVITPDLQKLTPDMLPLIDLCQAEIDWLVSQVPGGIKNIQDIYALSPLQDGILYHHLLSTEQDPYICIGQFAFTHYSLLSDYISAMQKVTDRHDSLRAAFFWEELSTPAQVILRKATLRVTEVTLNLSMGSTADQLDSLQNLHWNRMDLQQAPLIHLVIARDSDGGWLLLQLLHHLISDHTTLDIMYAEIKELMNGHGERLAIPTVPYRNHIANVRMSVSQQKYEQFFSELLSDVEEPTLLFDLSEVHRDGSDITEAQQTVPVEVNDQLRTHARNLDVSLASLCHVAWGLVAARTSGRTRVVFGTVLYGRMSSSDESNSAMGLYINTLPIKLETYNKSIHRCVRETHARLGAILQYENASLALAQRCSRVPSGTPMFNSLLNYRHNLASVPIDEIATGMHLVSARERTNFPLAVSIDDDISGLRITCLTVATIDSRRVCGYVQQVFESLNFCLSSTREIPANSVEVLPESERRMLLETLNLTDISHSDFVLIHKKFEMEAARTPSAKALVYEDEAMTYAELNTRANRLAHQLIEFGVLPDNRVGICITVSAAMIVGLLAILKAGGAYVPLDPTYPKKRLIDIINDASLGIVIVDRIGFKKLEADALTETITIDVNSTLPQPSTNPVVSDLRLQNLAYVIYTSGTTGKPKGVMIEHQNIVRLFDSTESMFHSNRRDVWCLLHSIAFDVSVWEIWGALAYGNQLVLMSRDDIRSPEKTCGTLCARGVTVLNQTPGAFRALSHQLMASPIKDQLCFVILTGESLDPRILQSFYHSREGTSVRFFNMYGPTEATVYATCKELAENDTTQSSSIIGKGLKDTRAYLLDDHGRPVPFGVVGELHIAGAGVARGYLNRPDLTSERFHADVFDDSLCSRMYQTGDLARYSADGNLVILGRNDEQIKIRGFRVETKEIESCLVRHPGIREAIVVSTGDAYEKILIAYVVAEAQDGLAQNLRQYLISILPDHMIPSKFVRLDSLPLTSNGKLNRQALPAPDCTSVARTSHEEPITNTERKLAIIWCQLLGIDKVGRNDNFFVLGGHSLLALRMNHLAADHGLVCTLNDLLRYPVLAHLAAKITPETTSIESYSAIPVRRAGTGPPLFFVPTGLGDYSYVFSLSEQISVTCPIYALPWPPTSKGQLSTMWELARKLVPLIRAIQPRGPYRICGYSTGGILCHAIAGLIVESGDSISFLGLIDTSTFHFEGTRAGLTQYFAASSLLGTIGIERKNDVTSLCRKTNDMTLVEFVHAAKELELLPTNLPTEVYAQQLEQRINYWELLTTYVPKNISLVVHQFDATEPRETDSSMDGFLFSVTSLDQAHPLSNATFQKVLIPGNHLTMMEKLENRVVLGQAISDAISKI